MNRVLTLQYALLDVIAKQEQLDKQEVPRRDECLDWERLHLASSARLGYLMAEDRGVDPELAACACAIHDYGRILTGKQKDHAEAGYGPVKEFLESVGIFTCEEIEQLALAVKNHSKKSQVGTPLEEIVKDADVVDCYQYGTPFAREEQKRRYDAYRKSSR